MLVTQLVTLCDPATPLSMGFSRQEYWSGLPFPSPGDFPDPGMEPVSPAQQEDSLPTEPPAAAAAAKSLQSCPTLCDPMDSSPTGSPIPGILRARILEWVAIPSPESTLLLLLLSRFSRVLLCATP